MDAIQTLDLAGARKQPAVGIVARADIGGSDVAVAEFLTALHAVDQTAPAEPDAAVSAAPVSEEDRAIAAEASVCGLGGWMPPMSGAVPGASTKRSGDVSDGAMCAPRDPSAGRVVTGSAPAPEPPTQDATGSLSWPARGASAVMEPETGMPFDAESGGLMLGRSGDKPGSLQSHWPPSDRVRPGIVLEGLAPAAAEPAVLSKGTIAEKGLTAGRGRTEGGDGRVDPMLQTRPAVEINPLGRGDPQSSLAGPIATADVPRPVVTDAMPRVEGAINASEGATSEEADITTQLTTSTSAQPSTDARRSGSGWPEALDGPVDFSGARKGRQRSDDPFQDIAPDQLNWPQGQARGLGRAAERGPSFAAHLPAPLPHGLGHQLADAVARFPGRPVEVTLSPEELGRVRMTLTTVDGGLTLTLVADRPETLDLMRRHIGQLAQDFRDMGFQNLSFSFAQGQDPGRAPERSFLTAEDDAALVAAPSEIPRPEPMKPLPLIPAEGLDIRI